MRRNAVRAGIIAVGALSAGAFEHGCGFEHGALTTTNNPIDGSVDALPDASECTAATDMCLGDVWRHCSGAGTSATDTTCNWGCSATTTVGTTHCRVLTPTGDGATPQDTLPDSQLLDVTLHTGDLIDGDTGKIGMLPTPMVRPQGTGIMNGIDYQHRNNVSVFRFKSLTISGDISLIGAHPIALVADGDITINGVIDARGPCTTTLAGPGGFAGGAKQGGDAAGSGSGQGVNSNNLGGGGGGNGGAGADGGDGTQNNGGGTGGLAFGDAQVSVLAGGGGGGGGGGGANTGSGGGGGGAVQIISNGTVSVTTGGINAGGCGGQTGSGGNDAGGGGGAGGTIVLEAPKLVIAAALAVNGGGGGGGQAGNLGRAANGSLDRTVAAGSNGTADGGNGAAGNTAPTKGGESGGKAGGGGGGIGRIRLNTRNDAGLDIKGSAVLSPKLDDTTNATCTRGAASIQ